jgi:hypothetical protein
MHDDPRQRQHEIERLSRAPRTGLLRELYAFLRENKKWWLAPIAIAVLLLGLLVLLSGGAAAPFLYPALF